MQDLTPVRKQDLTPVLGVLLLVAGCGSRTDLDSYPPPARPAAAPPLTRAPAGTAGRGLAHPPFPDPLRARLEDGRVVRLDPRRRELAVGGERVFAGAGPTHVVAGAGGRVYVTDTAGGSVLYFRTRPALELVRRAAVPGAPYGAAIDPGRRRIWVAASAANTVVALTADGAPRIRRRVASVRGPRAVVVDRGGTVFVEGAGGVVQRFEARPRLAGR